MSYSLYELCFECFYKIQLIPGKGMFRDHLFSSYAKRSEKLAFFVPG